MNAGNFEKFFSRPIGIEILKKLFLKINFENFWETFQECEN